MKKHFNITISGKVQGVYFRESTKAVADQLGVTGYIMNQPNTEVFIEAEAESFIIDSFIDWCNEGPERADVVGVVVQEGDVKGFTNFLVKK